MLDRVGEPGDVFLEANTTVALNNYSRPDVPAWQQLSKALPGGRAAVLLVNHGNASRELDLELSTVPGEEPNGRPAQPTKTPRSTDKNATALLQAWRVAAPAEAVLCATFGSTARWASSSAPSPWKWKVMALPFSS